MSKFHNLTEYYNYLHRFEQIPDSDCWLMNELCVFCNSEVRRRIRNVQVNRKKWDGLLVLFVENRNNLFVDKFLCVR